MDAVFALADRISVLVYGRVDRQRHARRRSATIREVRAAYLGEEDRVVSLLAARQPDSWLRRRARCCSTSSLEVGEGEVVTLLGRNGMGKSTTVKCLMGMLAAARRRDHFGGDGRDAIGPPTGSRGAGIGLVPEGRQIFPNLTVRENLVATAADRASARSRGRWSASTGCSRGSASGAQSRRGKLSGGEQQMLAIGRALMTNPQLLILDEATEGLAPLIRAEIWHCLRELKGEGLSMIVIDKNIRPLLGAGRPPLRDREGAGAVAGHERGAGGGARSDRALPRRLTMPARARYSTVTVAIVAAGVAIGADRTAPSATPKTVLPTNTARRASPLRHPSWL